MSYTKPSFKESYGNFINGKFVPPIGGQYFENTSPIDNTLIAKYPRSQQEDVDAALDAANEAKKAWGNTSVTERATMLNKVADIIEANLEEFALLRRNHVRKSIHISIHHLLEVTYLLLNYQISCE